MILALSQSMCWPPASQESEVTQLQASADSALLARTLREEYGYAISGGKTYFVKDGKFLQGNSGIIIL